MEMAAEIEAGVAKINGNGDNNAAKNIYHQRTKAENRKWHEAAESEEIMAKEIAEKRKKKKQCEMKRRESSENRKQT